MKEIRVYILNMEDFDEEFEMWVEAKKNGVSGVPSYSELLEDQQWKQKILNEVSELI